MSVVKNIEIDLINYTGVCNFQLQCQFIDENTCNILILRLDSSNNNEGWSENIDAFMHDFNGNQKLINIGTSNYYSKIILDVKLDSPWNLIESTKEINDCWKPCYRRLTLNTHFIPQVSRETFNELFNTDIVHLPSSMYAIGIVNGGAYKYNNNYGQHDWTYEINSTIDYIISTAFHNPGKPRDFYCIICALDGYMEGYYPSERTIPKLVGNDEYKGKNWVVLDESEVNKYPLLHKQRYVLGQSTHPDTKYTIAVPDRYYFVLHSYNLYRSIHMGILFNKKKPFIVYAGNVRGGKHNFTKRRDIDMPQRQYFKTDKVCKDNVHAPSYIERDNMIHYKYILDIDGNASTWDATAWKLNSGSVIFKVDSNWEQWFYKDYKEWEHYVPIADDFSDMQEKYKWCEENQDKCEEMIRNSKALFQSIYDPMSVFAYTKNMIDMFADLQENSEIFENDTPNSMKDVADNYFIENDLIKMYV